MASEKQLQLLTERLKSLELSLGHINQEVRRLKLEIAQLRLEPLEEAPQNLQQLDSKTDSSIEVEEYGEVSAFIPSSIKPDPLKEKSPGPKTPTSRSLEDFIGANVISKLGILILIIGLGILVKYAVDQNLISPWGRVSLAYGLGGVLVALAYYLRQKYRNYSAVLFSGGVSVAYFTSYLAYNYLELMPMGLAFGLMLACTLYTVWEALRYEEEVIGMIGMVGAYAVPLLLGKEGGEVYIFFIYLATINMGILTLAWKKDWVRMTYLAFGITWVIFLLWTFNAYTQADIWIHLGFGALFALILNLALSLRLAQNPDHQPLKYLLSFNSGIYFFLGIQAIQYLAPESQDQFLSWLSLAMVFVHLALAALWRRFNKNAAPVFQIHLAAAFVFLAIWIPIYLDQDFIALAWLAQALLSFALAREWKSLRLELFSFILLILSFSALAAYWQDSYLYFEGTNSRTFIVNAHFLISTLYAHLLLGFLFLNRRKAGFGMPGNDLLQSLKQNIDVVSAALFIGTLYLGLAYEIYHQVQVPTLNGEDEFLSYRFNFYLATFSFAYLAFWLFSQPYIFKNSKLGGVLIFAHGAIALFFLLILLPQSYELLDYETIQGIFAQRVYLYLALVISLVFAYLQVRQYWNKSTQHYWVLALHIFLIASLSFELSQGFLVIGYSDAVERQDTITKLGLSIFWGLYSLGLISFGIWKRRRFLRLIGFGLFGITILKLFLHDISYNRTLNVILALIGVGVLLLITAFLYQKYKDIILAEDA